MDDNDTTAGMNGGSTNNLAFPDDEGYQSQDTENFSPATPVQDRLVSTALMQRNRELGMSLENDPDFVNR